MALLNNEQRLTHCKLAIIEQSRERYSQYALSLLHHGYLLECGKRGGISKRWIGHVSNEGDYHAHLRDVYERAVEVRQLKEAVKRK